MFALTSVLFETSVSKSLTSVAVCEWLEFAFPASQSSIYAFADCCVGAFVASLLTMSSSSITIHDLKLPTVIFLCGVIPHDSASESKIRRVSLSFGVVFAVNSEGYFLSAIFCIFYKTFDRVDEPGLATLDQELDIAPDSEETSITMLTPPSSTILTSESSTIFSIASACASLRVVVCSATFVHAIVVETVSKEVETIAGNRPTRFYPQ